MPTNAVMWGEGAVRLDVRERAPGEAPRVRRESLQDAVEAEAKRWAEFWSKSSHRGRRRS